MILIPFYVFKLKIDNFPYNTQKYLPDHMKYIYAVYCATTFILFFLLFFPFIILFGILGQRYVIWWIVRLWSIIWLAMIGMRTQVSFKDNKIFSNQDGHIIIANHQSYLDVPLIFRAIPVMCRTLAKSELAKIPLFGYLYRQMTVLVDRSNPVSKRKSIMDLKKSLRKGENVFIFPEGTFNETTNTMIPFYDGAFKIALETKTNIIPVLFLDTVDRFHYKGFWNWTPGINRVVVLDEIDVSSFDTHEVKKLKHKAFNIMSEAMHQYKPNLEKVTFKD